MPDKCDRCERSPSTMVRDVKEIRPVGKYREWEAFGQIRKGCELHPVKSKRYMLDGSVTEDAL